MNRILHRKNTPLCLTLALLLGASTSVFADNPPVYSHDDSSILYTLSIKNSLQPSIIPNSDKAGEDIDANTFYASPEEGMPKPCPAPRSFLSSTTDSTIDYKIKVPKNGSCIYQLHNTAYNEYGKIKLTGHNDGTATLSLISQGINGDEKIPATKTAPAPGIHLFATNTNAASGTINIENSPAAKNPTITISNNTLNPFTITNVPNSACNINGNKNIPAKYKDTDPMTNTVITLSNVSSTKGCEYTLTDTKNAKTYTLHYQENPEYSTIFISPDNTSHTSAAPYVYPITAQGMGQEKQNATYTGKIRLSNAPPPAGIISLHTQIQFHWNIYDAKGVHTSKDIVFGHERHHPTFTLDGQKIHETDLTLSSSLSYALNIIATTKDDDTHFYNKHYCHPGDKWHDGDNPGDSDGCRSDDGKGKMLGKHPHRYQWRDSPITITASVVEKTTNFSSFALSSVNNTIKATEGTQDPQQVLTSTGLQLYTQWCGDNRTKYSQVENPTIHYCSDNKCNVYLKVYASSNSSGDDTCPTEPKLSEYWTPNSNNTINWLN